MQAESPLIEFNSFEGTHAGVWMEGAAGDEKVEVLENSFFENAFGTYFQGTNEFDIIGNQFDENDFAGALVYNSNSGQIGNNNISNNFFRHNETGISLYDNNEEVLFFENCFDHIYDAGVLIGAKFNSPAVAPRQMTLDETGPDNCFELVNREVARDGNSSDNLFPNVSTPEDPFPPFFSYGRDNTLQEEDCRVANLQFFFEHESLESNVNPCTTPPSEPGDTGSNTSTSEPEPFTVYTCGTPNSLVHAHNLLQDIQTEITTVEANADIDRFMKQLLLDKLRTCQRKTKSYIIKTKKNIGKLPELTVDFEYETDPYTKVEVFSAFMQEQEYDMALSYLEQAPSEGSAWDDFVESQEVNVERLSSPLSYEASEQQLQQVYDAGNKADYYATWSRAIYKALTGESIKLPLPGQNITPRSNESGSASPDLETVLIYPNPVYQFLNIEKSDDQEASYQIASREGRVLREGVLSKTTSITSLDLQELPDGLYFITIFGNDGVQQTKRIVKIQ